MSQSTIPGASFLLGKPFSYNNKVFVAGVYNAGSNVYKISVWYATTPGTWTRVDSTASLTDTSGFSIPPFDYTLCGAGQSPASSGRYIGIIARPSSFVGTAYCTLVRFDCSTLTFLSPVDFSVYNLNGNSWGTPGVSGYSGGLIVGSKVPSSAGVPGLGILYEGGGTLRAVSGMGAFRTAAIGTPSGYGFIFGEFSSGGTGAINEIRTDGAVLDSANAGSPWNTWAGHLYPNATAVNTSNNRCAIIFGSNGSFSWDGTGSVATSTVWGTIPLGGHNIVNWGLDYVSGTLTAYGVENGTGNLYKWTSTDNGANWSSASLLFTTPAASDIYNGVAAITVNSTPVVATIIGTTYTDNFALANVYISGSSNGTGSGSLSLSANAATATISGSSSASASGSLSLTANNPTNAVISGSSTASASGTLTVLAQTVVAYVGLYINATAGTRDGTIVSNLNPIKSSNLYLDGTDRVSAAIKVAIRTVNIGSTRTGNCVIQIAGTNASKWALAPDSGGSPGTWGAYGASLTLAGPLSDVNTIFWARARSTSDENVVQQTNDTSVVLRVPNNID